MHLGLLFASKWHNGFIATVGAPGGLPEVFGKQRGASKSWKVCDSLCLIESKYFTWEILGISWIQAIWERTSQIKTLPFGVLRHVNPTKDIFFTGKTLGVGGGDCQDLAILGQVREHRATLASVLTGHLRNGIGSYVPEIANAAWKNGLEVSAWNFQMTWFQFQNWALRRWSLIGMDSSSWIHTSSPWTKKAHGSCTSLETS